MRALKGLPMRPLSSCALNWRIGHCQRQFSLTNSGTPARAGGDHARCLVEGRRQRLLADDHPIVREGLHALISTEPNMIIVGEATNGEEAVRRVRELKPDVILMDLIMDRMDGIEAIERIKLENPSARILALTSFTEDDIVFPAIKACASASRSSPGSPRTSARWMSCAASEGVSGMAGKCRFPLERVMH